MDKEIAGKAFLTPVVIEALIQGANQDGH